MTEDKKPLEQAVELAVYAPIGFALEARRLLPDFVEKGRQQVTMAKMVGQFAVTHGQNEAAKRMTKVQEQAEAILAEFGLRPLDEPVPEDLVAAPAATPAAAPVAQSGAGASDLPISDYDSLAASQVIPRLDAMTAAERDAVEAYERAHRGRKTILGKIEQLREA